MLDLMALQGTIALVLWLALLGLKGFTFADAALRPAQVYPAANKQTKTFWLLLLGIALAMMVVPGFTNPLGIFNIVGTVAALVYLVGVRPAVKELGGGRGQSRARLPWRW